MLQIQDPVVQMQLNYLHKKYQNPYLLEGVAIYAMAAAPSEVCGSRLESCLEAFNFNTGEHHLNIVEAEVGAFQRLLAEWWM